jgi:lipoprotein-releasing system permease protein
MASNTPFGPFERMIAGRYLWARQGERFVSVIAGFSLAGIALGVATLIVVLSVMGGFRQELLGRILGLNGQLGIFPQQGGIEDYPALLSQLRALPGVMQAVPVVEGQVLFTTDTGASAGGLVRGVMPADLEVRPIVAENIHAGSLSNFGGENALVLGVGLARKLDVDVGDQVTVISPEGRATAFGTVPRLKTYRVVALFEAGLQDYDNGFAFMPLPAAQLFFQMPNRISQIEVHLADAQTSEMAGIDIRRALSNLPLRITDWQDANSAFFDIVRVQRNVMFLILTLIILVAAFNIISSLTMLVKDKAKDIAILRTMGVGRTAMLRIFLICGGAIGSLGTLLGLGLGLAFCAHIEAIRQFLIRLTGTTLFDPEIYFLTRIPAVVDWYEIAQVALLALGLALLATLWPSWRAASLDPVEALRNE